MRILHVNKFLYRRGGAEAHMLDVASLQRAAGHDVALWGMAHPENPPLPHAGTFAPYMELDPPPAGVVGKVKGFGRMVHSRSARLGIAEVLDTLRPDVVHLHNIYHQLSPSILAPIAAHGIPAVMTLHDYKLACPTYRFLDGATICEACLGGRFRNAVVRRCKDGSLTASAAAALELAIHTRTDAYGSIDRFLCPSRFLAGKMAAAGVYPERLRVLPNFVDVDAITPKSQPGGGIAYVGRLSTEKAVDVLIEAVAALPDVVLDVAGDGPDRPRLEVLAATRAPGRVRFHGRLGREDVLTLLRGAAVAAVPSRWYENQPISVLEAFACGVPVVATALGGLPELVTPGRTGALVPPDDPAALAAALDTFVTDPDAAYEQGVLARSDVRQDHHPDVFLAALHEHYEAVCEVAA